MQSPVRAAVRGEVLQHLDEVTTAVVGKLVEQIPAYAALSGEQLAEVAAIAEWGTTRILQLWVEDRQLSEANLARFRGIGAARALDGRPLPGVLRAYRLAGTEIADLIEREGSSRLTVADAMALTRLWMSSVDTLSEALYAGHTAASERTTGDRPRALADFVDDLLLGRQVTRTALGDRSRELGVALAARVDLLVVAPADARAQVTAGSLRALLAGLVAPSPAAELTSLRNGTGVAVLPIGTDLGQSAVAERRWRGCLIADVRLTDLPRAFRLAEQLVRHAPGRAYARRAVLDEADAQVLALVRGDADADPERLETLAVTPLRVDGEHLVEGLDAYLTTGSASEAAALLGVHPQTMRYRLRRIAEITGRDPRAGWDRFVLESASLTRRHPPAP